ncbi:MAG: trypsin-like peptidase domain-containing protein [Planctomycetaceae bacterium]|nr:trypsin-like peptidase domain-containing protein [Planctomycetaceae bacterium]
MSIMRKFILSLILILIFNFVVGVVCAADLSVGQEQNVKLIFVTSPDSPHCNQATPLINEFKQNGYNIQIISVAQYPNITKQLNITKLPAFILLQNDKIIDRVDGGSAPIVLKPMIQGMFDRADRSARKNITKITPTQTQNSIPTPTPTSTPLPAPATPSNHYAKSISNTHNLTTQNLTTQIDPDLLQRKFITSSVKLRVDSANGHSWGSGTIIDTRGNDALILTCGHIFRESSVAGNNNKIIVEVHLYGENSSVKVYGRCIYFDLEIDLALVVIVPPCPVYAIPVAPSNLAINSGQDVISVGCDGGANPTIRKHSIMSINRIGTPTTNKLPFHYIQVSGAPVGGRSGGGLFSRNGQLIGVCNTADPLRNDGHFVPAEIIRYVLDQQKLSIVYQNPSLKNPTLENSKINSTTENNLDKLNKNQNQNPHTTANLTPIEQATLSEVKRRVQDGDEVILIVRSRRNLETPSDVIVLNNTSEQFIDNLIQQSPTQNENKTNNQIILSSHSNQTNTPQPVTFNVPHNK